MKSNNRFLIVFFLLAFAIGARAQNETAKWYFGSYAGLDFMTNPPTSMTNSAMFSNFGSASMADANGNLLFYTDGANVYTSTHTLMANGSGLFGGTSNNSQPCLIIRRPGSTTLYYVFTIQVNNVNFSPGLHYSIVDMSLAAGQGSVTVKNAQLYSGYVGGKLTGSIHCNGVDYWVVIRDWNTSNGQRNFRSYLLTATGASTVAVISPAISWTNTTYYYDGYGCMKISPNGRKLACANYNNYYYQNNTHHAFELYDFNNSTGAVTNSLALGTTTFNNNYYNRGWGVEFSPDGTKLYGSRWDNYNYNYGGIYHWDLCAGSNSAIAASETVVATSTTTNYYWHADLQLAKDGKIYVAHWYGSNSQSISVIHNPNLSAAACNYSFLSQSIAPNTSRYGLPNFVGSHFSQPPPVAPFTHTVSNGFGCQAAAFTSPAMPNTTVNACSTIGYSLTSLEWSFGDPASGSSNTTTVTHPIHAFTTLGTYTVQLILRYSCGGGTDTLRQVVNINQPCISVTSTSITCANLGSATVVATGGIGPFSYTWMPTGQTNSVATGLSPGTYTLTVFDFGNNFTYTATTVFTSLIPLTGDLTHSSSLTCNGVNNATATVINLAGGSGTVNFNWTNGAVTHTTNPLISVLSAGVWTVVVTDSLTGCTVKEIFQVTQPPPLSINLAASTPSTCVGTSITLSGITSGGIPGYTYSWQNGPPSDSMVVSEPSGGPYTYTLNSLDTNNCTVSNTITVNFVNNPVISITHASICPLQTGTISLSGASTYTWFDNSTGPNFSDNPMVTSVYSFTGAALGCTTAATASIILKPLPQPVAASNSPRCNGQNLQLFATGGSAYLWEGPQLYTSSLQNPIIAGASTLQSGVYNLTVTAANSCTAPLSTTVVVHPTPTLSTAGSTVCVDQTLFLYASSFPGAGFSWKGPVGYTSLSQNPVINTPPVVFTGNYTVTVTSAVGCTNSATAHGSVTPLPVPSFITNSPLCFGKTLQLDANATTGAESFLWSGPNGFTSNSQNNSIANITVPASGIYSLLVTAGPCTAAVSKPVVVNPLPTPIIVSNNPVCETKTLLLDAVTPNFNIVTYLWNGPGGYVSMLKNPSIPNTGPSDAGTYNVSVIDINGCISSAAILADIRPNPVVTATGTLVCRYDAATLTADGAYNYSWAGPNLIVDNGAQAIVGSATNDDPVWYQVTGTAVNGCTAVATASLGTRVLPTPVITISPKSRLCLKEQVVFKGSGGLSYEWSGPLNVTYAGASVTVPLNYMVQAGEYTLAVLDEFNCKGKATTSILIDDLPQGTLLGNKGSCVPFCADYQFASPSGASKTSVRWELNKQVFNDKNFSYCFTKPGQHIVRGIFTDTTVQCSHTETFIVTAYAQPVADFSFSPETPVENMDEVLFTNSTYGENVQAFSWHISHENYKTKQENHSYLFKDAGTYVVALMVADERGCSDTVIKTVTVAPDFNFYIPNAFTPNGDDNNEVFLPSVRGVKQYHMRIFNRWGDLLFESEDTGFGWDGNFRGQPCKDEVYVWQVSLSTIHGERKTFNGHVTLYR